MESVLAGRRPKGRLRSSLCTGSPRFPNGGIAAVTIAVLVAACSLPAVGEAQAGAGAAPAGYAVIRAS